MGLDVYLKEPLEKAREAEVEQKWSDLDAKDLSEEEKKAATTALLEEEREVWTTNKEEYKSRLHPEHMFTRRYLRSSYNGGGFNNAVPDFVGEQRDLYWVFEPLGRGDAYEFDLTQDDIGALEECKRRAEELAAQIRDTDAIRVMTEGSLLPPAKTAEQAIACYREVISKRDPDGPFGDSAFTNADGFFSPGKPLEVVALIPGTDIFGRPATHVIYKADTETVEWYAQSADVTAEFIQEAIDIVNRDGRATVIWSG